MMVCKVCRGPVVKGKLCDAYFHEGGGVGTIAREVVDTMEEPQSLGIKNMVPVPEPRSKPHFHRQVRVTKKI